MIERQQRDVERAFTINAGPYEVAPDYITHREDANKWVKRTKGYKEKVVNRIHKLPAL